MQRTKRATRRINYAKLHETGEKEYLSEGEPSVEEVDLEEEEVSEYETAIDDNSDLHSDPETDDPESTINDPLNDSPTPTKIESRDSERAHDESALPFVDVVVPSDLIVDITDEEGINMTTKEQLDIDSWTVREDIDDFLEENAIAEIGTNIQDFDNIAKRAEELRTQFRSVHNKLKSLVGQAYQEEYGTAANEKLTEIKDFIKELKKARKNLRENESVQNNTSRASKFTFLRKEFLLMADEIEKLFIVHESQWKELDDVQLTKRKETVEDDLKTLNVMHDLITNIMDVSTDEKELKAITDRYEKILSTKTVYTMTLHEEYQFRQIEERKAFDQAKLSIKLPKFKGYTGVDIYTFRSDFEKLHVKSTPREFLPDLLKNNYLENPALLLVKDVKEVDEIWKRLTLAYGDCKILLSNKVSELSKIGNFSSKNSDSESVLEGLSSIIHLMKDLMRLAKEHNIEERLFHGSAMEHIQDLMGDARFTRWLSVSCDKDLTDERKRWTELLVFLEKEVRIHQQKLLYSSKSRKPPPSDRGSNRDSAKKPPPSTSSRQGHHHQNDGANPLTCFICGATDHVPTSGPKGTKLIQYFVCKKFVEMTNAERLALLKAKNLCFQCLYPGADRRASKHKEGRCQREFTCKHPSHDRYDTKKHILVCDEHKAEQQNIAIFEDYKQRCITRQNQVPLPDYAKKILIHHVLPQASNTPSPEPPASPLTPQNQVPLTSTGTNQGASIPSLTPGMVSKGFSIPVPQHLLSPIEEEPAELRSQIHPESPQVSSEVNTHLQPSQNSVSEPLNLPTSTANASDNQGTSNISPEETSLHTTSLEQQQWDEWNNKGKEPVYILQRIIIDNDYYNIFYDSGCKNFCSRHSAVQRMRSAMQTQKGPTTIWGVAGMKMETPHGYYSVCIPLRDGGEAIFSGICLDSITETFPTYPLKGEVEQDIKNAFAATGGDVALLPALEPEVGGDTDFMIGIKYNRHFPTEVYRCPISGLSIYRSQFRNASGGYGVVGGSHRVFAEIEKYHHTNHNWTFVASQENVNFLRSQVNPDLRLLGHQTTDQDVFNTHSEQHEMPATVYKTSIQSRLRKFEDSQLAGSEIQYRCVRCRSCEDCKKCEKTISIKEEVEQDLIERSVHVDIENRITTAELPFTGDPLVKLSPNRNIALKVYNQQLRKINKCPADKEAILKSEAKLQAAGYVAYVKDLPEEMQKILAESPHQNFYPWLVAYKASSQTTPARLVFDASRPTATGYSINDILAKGTNNLNHLLEIFIRFRIHKVAFHNDVNKMYNNVRLQSHHWCFQRYLFEPNLDPNKEPLEKVIMTVIYGAISSGNQAECGLRKTAQIFQEEYPEAHDVIVDDHYVDDCISGEETTSVANRRMDELELVLNYGGFTLKGFTVSGCNPDESLTSDGVSIALAGHKWFSKEDLIALDIKDLNFAKKQRGRKVGVIKEIPKKLTRRICTSKVAEVFDFSGLISPITASWKVDLHDLVVRKLDWDDTLPDNLRPLWETNFKLMGELADIKFQRAIIPEDAANLNISTLEFGDASKSLVCAAIYVRFLRKCGSYSCQLILSKTRLVPDGMTQPRAELYAAVVNTHTSQVVKRALSKYHRRSTKFTDSQIVLFWLTNDSRALKQWLRDRVIEILRWTSITSWYYVHSHDMIADIGTRRCSSIEEVDQDSVWANGFEWMRGDNVDFPTMTADQIKLNNNEIAQAKTELVFSVDQFKTLKDLLLERYNFSNYLIDPNHRTFEKVIRILAIALKFIRITRERSIHRKSGHPAPKSVSATAEIFIPQEDVSKAEMYFHRKATAEIQHFLEPRKYTSISKEIDGVLYYSGRILPEDEVTIVGNATRAMTDLTASTFCVPMTDKHSPIALSLVNDVHWNNKSVQHSGVETTWRFVLQKMYVIEGRSLVKLIRNDCQRCRYLEKKALSVQMGPISKHNIMIAPAFYVSQVDLAGPFSCYSPHHKRTTIKIWLVIFVCTTTSATSIKVMESYCTTSFLQAFTRFACQVGYPKQLLTDEGGQLVKGAKDMIFDFRDLQYKLNKDTKVLLDVCPVGGHNFHGKVERKIRHVKESLEKSVHNERLGILQWETVVTAIANSINNLPLALGNVKGDFEVMDLITPNRLLLGRNNNRSPDTPLVVTENYDRTIRQNRQIFQAWFECWLLSHVPKLIEQPKWFRSDRDLKEGDIVLFLKQESELSSTYQYGAVNSLKKGRDEKIRQVEVRYRNNSENVDRFTTRAVRSLIMIHPVDEITVMQELGDIAAKVDANRPR